MVPADTTGSAVFSREALWRIASTVLDPEVPVLTVVDLGVVRDVRERDGDIEIDITPTYSGCPAMQTIEEELVAAFQRAGAGAVRVRTVFQPPWTTDWMSDDARAKLKAYGIAPPRPTVGDSDELIPLRRRTEPVPCPYCGSPRTQMRSAFGSTACKALLYCDSCQQPFEHFKAI